MDRLKQDLADFQKGDEVPTEAELHQLRQTRDHGWSLVLAKWKQLPCEENDVRQFLEQCSPAKDLADAFLSSVRRTDAVADRLRREADRVATKVQLESRMDALRKRFEDAGSQQLAIEQNQTQHLSDWKDRWSATGVSPLTPRDAGLA